MYDQPNLSDEEWALVVELLEQERDELPVEIHHARVSRFRAQLRQRAEMVQRLLERLKAPVGAA